MLSLLCCGFLVQGKPVMAAPPSAAAKVAVAEEAAEGSGSSVRFSAEAKFGAGHLFVAGGLAHSLPEAAREVVGQDLHVTALIGAQQLQVDGAEYGIEAGWVEGTPLPAASLSIGAPALPSCAALRSKHAAWWDGTTR